MSDIMSEKIELERKLELARAINRKLSQENVQLQQNFKDYYGYYGPAGFKAVSKIIQERNQMAEKLDIAVRALEAIDRTVKLSVVAAALEKIRGEKC